MMKANLSLAPGPHRQPKTRLELFCPFWTEVDSTIIIPFEIVVDLDLPTRVSDSFQMAKSCGPTDRGQG